MGFVAGAGKTNVDLLYNGMPRIPGEGEEIYARGFSLQLGGGVPAALIRLGCLKVETRLQTFLGKDLFSGFAAEELGRFRTRALNLYAGDGMPVNVSCAVITPRDRAFISYSDPLTVTQEQQERALADSAGARVVLMHEAFLPIYPALRAAGALLVYDTGWREDMSLASMGEVLALADHYLPNSLEAMRVTGTQSVSEAARVLSAFFPEVVIKLGAEGCLILKEGRERIIPAVPGTAAVDATGAGDAFLAGFVYGLLRAEPLERCVLYGNITGAACVEGMGALSGCMDGETLLDRALRLEAAL